LLCGWTGKRSIAARIGDVSIYVLFCFHYSFWLPNLMKEREVKKFIQEQGLSFCGLIESKVQECKKEEVLNAIGRSWNVFCNYGFVFEW
jgi:hypothetical protein